LGLALIAGSNNFVKPAATLDALVPGFLYFASWYVLGAVAFWFVGFETSGRTIDEIDREVSRQSAGRGAQPASHVAGN
jgi:putative MFS transporter